MQKRKIILIVGILILAAAGALYLAVKSESAKIATFEECVKAGWLVRSIKVYDGDGLVEQECFLWTGKSFVKLGAPAGQLGRPGNSRQNLEAKTDDQSAVTVTVAPIDISPQSKEWKFNVVMDTHSVELNQDMTKFVVLTDDQSKEYRPLAWEGAGPGGHHREGILIFNPIEPTPKYVELKIKNVGGVAERSFQWSLE